MVVGWSKSWPFVCQLVELCASHTISLHSLGSGNTGEFSSLLLCSLFLCLGQYCQPQTEYSPVFPPPLPPVVPYVVYMFSIPFYITTCNLQCMHTVTGPQVLSHAWPGNSSHWWLRRTTWTYSVTWDRPLGSGPEQASWHAPSWVLCAHMWRVRSTWMWIWVA